MMNVNSMHCQKEAAVFPHVEKTGKKKKVDYLCYVLNLHCALILA